MRKVERFKGWRLFKEFNTAFDEHMYMPGVVGLFTVRGRCLIGLTLRVWRWRGSYHPEIALILNNWQIGLWREPIE